MITHGQCVVRLPEKDSSFNCHPQVFALFLLYIFFVIIIHHPRKHPVRTQSGNRLENRKRAIGTIICCVVGFPSGAGSIQSIEVETLRALKIREC